MSELEYPKAYKTRIYFQLKHGVEQFQNGSNNFTLCVYDYIAFVLEDLLIVDLSLYLLPAILMYNWKVYNLPQL